MFNAKATFKKLPLLQQLTLDLNTANQLVVEYGETAQDIWKMFQENKNLRVLTIDKGNGAVNFYRNNFADTASVLTDLLGLQKFKMQSEVIVASKNPRLVEKGAGYMNNISKGLSSYSHKSIKEAGDIFFDKRNKKVRRALGYSALSAGTIVLWAPVTLLGKLLDATSSVANKFK
jgi:hypothetical protein